MPGYPTIEDHAFEFTNAADEAQKGRQIIRDTFTGLMAGALNVVTFAAWADGDTSGDVQWTDADQDDDWGMQMGKAYIVSDGRLYMPTSSGFLSDGDVLTREERQQLAEWVDRHLGEQ